MIYDLEQESLTWTWTWTETYDHCKEIWEIDCVFWGKNMDTFP
jgi:hypothetical protein